MEGANVLAGQTHLQADNNIELLAAESTYEIKSFDRSSGFSVGLSNGLPSASVGSDRSGNYMSGTQQTATVIQTTNGDANIVAGNTYTQTGSHLLSQGDTTISAKSIDMGASYSESESQQTQESKSFGIGTSVNLAPLEAIKSTIAMAENINNASDTRSQLLGIAALQMQAGTSMVNMATNPASLASVDFTMGFNQSASKSNTQQSLANGSGIQSGGQVTLLATGGGDSSNITLTGANIDASQVRMRADNDIILRSAISEQSQSSKSENSGVSVGVNVSFTGVSGSASANSGNSSISSHSVAHTHTQINAGQVSLISGNDLVLHGARVDADSIHADVGGDLRIESVQDIATYRERSENSGVGVTVPIAGGNLGVNGNRGEVKIDASHASVTQQSGLFAGDGGFDVDVQGQTTLRGGAIASSQAAEDAGLNQFASVGEVSISNLRNHSEYSAESSSVNAGLSSAGPSGSAGRGEDEDRVTSTTYGGITGVSTYGGQDQILTGDDAGTLENVFDADAVRDDVNAQVAISQSFGQQSAKLWGDLASQNQAELTLEAWNESDPERRQELLEEADRWSEGGIYRLGGHALLSGANGGIEGAAGSLASGLVMSDLAESIEGANLPEEMKQALGMAAASTVGAAMGGASGATAAFNTDVNNRQLHSFERSLAEEIAKDSPYTVEQIEAAMRSMHNLALGEHPIDNKVIDLMADPDAVNDLYYDYGGDWQLHPDGDGQGRYLIQMSEGLDYEIAAYIVGQTGGEDGSPYYVADRTLPAERARPGQERDFLTGRPLDENGQYTVSQVVDGKVYHLKYWPCGDAECVAANTGLDAKNGDYDAWQQAMNIKLLRDASTAGTAVLMVTPPGAMASLIGRGATATGIYSDYLDDNLVEGLSSQLLGYGMGRFLKDIGTSDFSNQRIVSGMDLLGAFDLPENSEFGND